jgi:glutamate 5-kinase
LAFGETDVLLILVTPTALLSSARRITVKVGSSLLVGEDGVRSTWLASLATDLAALVRDGRHVIVVSSGAVGLGRGRAALPAGRRLDVKQAAAALGQPLLMRAWSDAFAKHGLAVAQLLLTLGDTESRSRWRNARATVEMLLRSGAVPVVNENDSVATEELRYGDNDRLSARVAQMAGADLLVLLSDVDGLFATDPRRAPEAVHVPRVDTIDDALLATAGPAHGGGLGTGGMRTKLEAARIAQQSGCATLIANGTADHPLSMLSRATIVAAHGSPTSAYKAWIAGGLKPAGRLLIDDGAATALRSGSSLLPAGVREVEGDFPHGASVSVVAPDRSELARGLARYGSAEARSILGRRASDIAGLLGYTRGDELIHRDDLVLR